MRAISEKTFSGGFVNAMNGANERVLPMIYRMCTFLHEGKALLENQCERMWWKKVAHLRHCRSLLAVPSRSFEAAQSLPNASGVVSNALIVTDSLASFSCQMTLLHKDNT